MRHKMAVSGNHIDVRQSQMTTTEEVVKPLSLKEACADGSPPPPLSLGDRIVWISDNGPEYGYVKWLGKLPDVSNDWMAGVDFDNPVGSGTGLYNDHQLFETKMNHASLVPVIGLMKAQDFLGALGSPSVSSSSTSSSTSTSTSNIILPQKPRRIKVKKDIDELDNGLSNSDDVPSPLSTIDDLHSLCGKNRGIQGHHNSCYLDATLFAMFSCTTIFESLLYRPPRKDDIPEYCEVQRILKEEIVIPLRKNYFVSADMVMHLRTLLEKISSVRGLTSEEKDPEEFLNLLLNEILKAEPYLKLSSGLESFFYQLFVEKDEKLQLPTVQQLFDQSFLASDIKLREVPPCLLIQMPRFGRQFKMYPRIIPSLYLDITDVLENSPRQCTVCGQLAEFECKECFGQFGEGLDSIAFCNKCMDKTHGHKKRVKHKVTKLKIPPEFNMLKEHSQIPRIYMELFAVLCIETR